MEHNPLTMCPPNFNRMVGAPSQIEGGRPRMVSVPIYHEWRQRLEAMTYDMGDGAPGGAVTSSGGFFCINCLTHVYPDGTMELFGTPKADEEDVNKEEDSEEPSEEVVN